MKKLFSLFIIFFTIIALTSNQAYSAINKQINANIKTKRIPSGTIISLKMLDYVSSATSSLGDQFDLMIAENVKVNNSIVIPEGSVIRGSIEDVTSPKMLYKGGMVRLYFDHVVSSTGKQVPIYAGICNNKNVTYDGALSSKSNYKTAFTNTAQTTKNIVTTPTTWAWEKGDDILNGTPKYVLAPVTAVVAAPVAGIYFVGDSVANLFKKGENISLSQGETIQVQLIKPLDMPVY